MAELEESYVEALELLRSWSPQQLSDYVEFGVCRGDSMICMANASRRVGHPNMRLIGFDSFQGLPDQVAGEDQGVWQPGQFRFSEAAARRNLSRNAVAPERFSLEKGWFDQTATPERAAALGLRSVCVAMIDCDAYSSARAGLDFLAPLLADRAVLFFDDWHSNGLSEAGEGERRAFEEWLASHPEVREVRRLAPYSRTAEVIVVQTDRDRSTPAHSTARADRSTRPR